MRGGSPGAWSVVAVVAVVTAAASGGCRTRAEGGGQEPRPGGVAASSSEPAPSARIPDDAGAFTPGLAALDDTKGDLGRRLAEAGAACESCHAEIVAQWQGSAHAASSFDNPVYRASVESLRQARGERASRMCAACHDVALLVDGAIDAAVEPSDARAHAGVSCLVCHGIVQARLDGNGSYRLRSDDIAIPVEGEPATLRAHRERMAGATLRQAEMCGTCHKSFLSHGTGHDHFVDGLDDYGPWRRSVYAGSHLDRVDEATPRRTCAACHMPRVAAPLGDVSAESGTVRSHRFPGGHTWLAAMQDDEAQRRASEALLRKAATLTVSAVRYPDDRVAMPADGAALRPGEDVVLELVVRNVGVGHQFPGGTLDVVDSWIEVVVTDAAGDTVASAGRRWRDGVADDSLHRFYATLLDDDGRPVEAHTTQHFRAPGYDHTIGARDRQVVRFAWTVPEQVGWPLSVAARLLHRSRDPELQRAACEVSRTPRGRAWAAARRARDRPVLDPCEPLPITVAAEDRIALSSFEAPPRGAGEQAAPTARVAIDHGYAWFHALVEEIDRARPSFELALRLLEGDRSSEARRMRAATLFGLAAVSARQGRIEEMERWLAAAESVVPGEPSYAWVRGRALMTVWRHEEAIPWLRVAAASAPLDDRAWTALAVAAGSSGKHDAALAAARKALELAPRAPDPLRTQALALRGLGRDDTEVRTAMDAFLKHRRRDDGPDLRSQCSMDVAGCARERTPNHVHPMQ